MTEIKNLIKKYREQTGLSEKVASKQLLVMLAVARNKKPRAVINDVTVNNNITRFHFANGNKLRFSPESQHPIWEISEGKTHRPRDWHKKYDGVIETNAITSTPDEKS